MPLFPKEIEYEIHTANSTSGYYDDDGDWISGDTGLLEFLGSVQPITGKELTALQVGRVDVGKVKIYSDRILPVSKEGGDEAGAIVLWEGQRWEVIDQLKFQNGLISHYKYVGEYRGEV